ncbi:MAG: glycosyltransferase family 39 protein [Planctomycetes bacterium]|nr:glycosyltransferase family 39 protein [Planctomycetota bacterium]MCB9888256.1 glycosyltransferase family 39 protein [Planctomycetota bacterium]
MRLPPLVVSIPCLALVVQLVCRVGLIASDDLGYARFAAQIANGTFHPELHHYAFRYGLTVPVAVVYRLAGVQEWSTVLIPLLASCASVALLVHLAERLGGRVAAGIAGVLYATFPVQVHHATILVPEPVAEMFALAAIAVYWRALERGSARFGGIAGILLGCGFLAKEPAFFIALAVGLHGLVRRRWSVVAGLLTGAALVGAGELAYHALAAGDPLLRLRGNALHEVSPMALAANEDLTYRLFKAYPRMMLVPAQEFGIHSLVALPLALLGWWWCPRPQRGLLQLWTVLPWVYINFGSSSFDHFFALPVAPRYIEFTYPPLFVLCGIALARMGSAGRGRQWLVAGLVAATAAGGVYGSLRWQDRVPRIETVRELRRVAVELRNRRAARIAVEQPPEPAGTQVKARWARTAAILLPGVEIVVDPQRADAVVEVRADGSVAVRWR